MWKKAQGKKSDRTTKSGLIAEIEELLMQKLERWEALEAEARKPRPPR